MKIKKSLFTTEIEFSVDEIARMNYVLSPVFRVGLLTWIREVFGLDLITKKK
jgi:hypothetical protein